MPDTKKKSGASPDTRETKALKMALLRRLYAEDPGRTWEEIVSIFKAEGLEIARGTIRKYKSVMSKSAPKGST
jgi:DNA-directed RNA polymerase specialized sigma54-like protein